MDRQAAINGLSPLVHVLNEATGRVPETYLEDGRHFHGDALVAVAPKDLDEVRAVIEYARKNNLQIIPQGQRTGLVGATVPEPNEADHSLIMSMERFRAEPIYNEVDERVIVAAGMRLGEVNEFLKQFGKCVAIDISVDPMFGGMAATNVGGSSVVKYGDFRQMCRGIQAVYADSDAHVYSTIGGSTKRNGESDYTNNLVGSNGVLAVITQVELDVFPIIEHSHTAWFQVPDDVDLSALVVGIKENFHDLLLACEFTSKEALAAIKNSPEQAQSGTSMPFESDIEFDAIFIEWEGSADDLGEDEHSQELLFGLIEKLKLGDPDILPVEATWNIRHRTSDAVAASGAKLIGCDISATTQQVGHLRALVRSRVREMEPRLTIGDFGHLGDGGLHMNIVVPEVVYAEWKDAGILDEKILSIRMAVSEIAVNLHGDFSAEHGRGATNRPIAERFADPTSEAMTAALKTVTDPLGILGHPGSQPIVAR